MPDGRLDYILTLADKGFSSTADSATTKSEGLKGSLSGIGKTAAGLGIVAAGVAGIKKAIGAAAAFEQTQVALRTIVGDFEKADQLIANIRKLGAETPFETSELLHASRILAAFGEDAQDIPGVLQNIGDLAAGTAQSIGDIADIYGRARVQGTLFAEDLNQLAGRGIPIFEELGKILGVSQDQIKKMASEGKITFPLLEETFANLTTEGGRFHNMMQAQSKTTSGLFSTIKSQIDETFIILGQPINDALRPMLVGAIELLTTFNNFLPTVIQNLKDFHGTITDAFSGVIGDLLGLEDLEEPDWDFSGARTIKSDYEQINKSVQETVKGLTQINTLQKQAATAGSSSPGTGPGGENDGAAARLPLRIRSLISRFNRLSEVDRARLGEGPDAFKKFVFGDKFGSFNAIADRPLFGSNPTNFSNLSPADIDAIMNGRIGPNIDAAAALDGARRTVNPNARALGANRSRPIPASTTQADPILVVLQEMLAIWKTFAAPA
ncbi:MAG: phage tail tape measure protein [Verrucomicrobiota bacterium]